MNYKLWVLLFLFLMIGHSSFNHEHIIDKPIIISESNQHIDFKDRLITLDSGANCPMLIIGSIEEEPTIMIENIVIENLRLDGNKDFQDYEIWYNRENYIRNNAISIRFCKNVTIRNCIITNARSGNIVIEKGCQNITIENCILNHAFFDGIAGYASRECIIRNNIITDNHSAGLSFDLQFNKNTITDNVIEGNNLGVFLRYCDDNTFNRNEMKNTEYDFYLNQVDDQVSTIPKNNLFRDNNTLKNFVNQK